MRSRIGLLGVLVLAAGCARSATVTGLEEGAPCLEDGDCGDGMQCIDGACRVVTDCSSSQDCAADQSCQGGYCVANDSCTEAADCPPDQTCVDGQCTRMGACSDDATCPPEAHCEDGACVQNAACTSDADCPVDQTCGDGGVCERNPVCTDDADCPLTQSCVDGTCQRNDACTSDADCPGDQHCGDAGVCERNDPCAGNSSCPIDQHCEDGTCARNGTCQDSDDCPLDQACVDGVCLRHAGCRADVDCDNQLWCDGRDVCDIGLGCVIEDVPAVNDFVSCTVDSCDEANDVVRHTPDHAFCDDNEACTDDSCDLTLGCQNVADDANLVPQVDGDCRTAVCSGGHTVQSPNDGDLPADDGIACTVARCQAGNVQMQYTHTMCEDYKPCTRDECTAAGCINPSDNTLTPPQVPNQFCQKQVCTSGDITTVEDTSDTGPDSNINDCVNPACNGIVPTTVPDNFEIPIVSTPPDACKKWVCQAGSPAQGFDDSAVAPADASGNCRTNICAQGVTPISDRSDAPADSDPNDCWKPQCNSAEPSVVENVADDHDHPTAMDNPNDCKQPACRGGNVVDIADATDLPVNASSSDCQRPVCNGTTPGTVADDTETPPVILHNCRQETCVGGAPSTSVIDNADEPAADGITCTVEECQNGSPVHREDSGLCTANFCDGPPVCSIASGGCTTGADPVCTPANATCFTSACVRAANSGAGACVDTAINGDGDAVTKCGPDNVYNGGANNTDDDCRENDSAIYPGHAENIDGKDNDCDGYTDEGQVTVANCANMTQAPSPTAVFQQTSVTANISDPSGGVAPYLMEWSVTAEPRANSLALTGVTTNQVRFTPILYGAYTLRLRLTQPNAADIVCDKIVNVPAPNVGINVTLYMEDAVDVDLHLMHPWGDPTWISTFDGWTSDYDCYFGNCKMCTVTVPGQGGCAATGPLEWDAVGGLTNGDPTLDVDNLRGCYTDANGIEVCTPESISIVTPPANGSYVIAVHYYGPAYGQSATPAIDVYVKAFCRGASTTYELQSVCQALIYDPYTDLDWCIVGQVNWDATGCTSITSF
jgi:hypothetical protein